MEFLFGVLEGLEVSLEGSWRPRGAKVAPRACFYGFLEPCWESFGKHFATNVSCFHIVCLNTFLD